MTFYFCTTKNSSTCLVDAFNSLHVTSFERGVTTVPFGGSHHFYFTSHFFIFSIAMFPYHAIIPRSRSSKPFCFRVSKTCVAFIFNVCGHSNITICVGGAQTQCIWGCTLLWYWACSLGWYSYSANKWMTMIRLIALLFFLSLLSLSIVKSPTWHQFSVRKLAKSLLSVSKIREFLCFFFII